MQLRSFPTHRNATGWQAKSQFLHPCHGPFADAIRSRPGDVWGALERIPLAPSTRDIFARARAEDSDFAVPTDVVFPTELFPIQLTMACTQGPDVVSFDIDDAEALSSLRSALSGQWRDSPPGSEDIEYAQQLMQAGVLAEASPLSIDWSAPGIYRLQHASLLFRSPGATVLTDPVFVDPWIWAGSLPPIDAILISHAHGDHFSLASLMQFPRDTRIIVPRCRRASMLGDDLATLLELAGFTNVCTPPWHSSVQVEDIEVTVLPFYGEQPWVTFESPSRDLRNAGNTYRLDQGGFSSWVLIDAGHEFGHSMLEVAEHTHAELGPVDLVLSNLRTFPWHPGQIDGSGRFLFCFSLEQLADPSRWPDGRSITLGPAGLHEVLDRCGAGHFFPYAHWWHQPGSAPHLVDSQVLESSLVTEIGESARRRGRQLSTRPGRWGVGDRLHWRDGDVYCSAFV